MKFLKTIRFDPSDTHVFENAAGENEWAVPGGFCFLGEDPSALIGKRKQAFANGFFSVESFGHSTLCSVTTMAQSDLEFVETRLAGYFEIELGAPDAKAAQTAAAAEAAFVLDLCAEADINAVFALNRSIDEDGETREVFRLVPAPGADQHARVWEIVED